MGGKKGFLLEKAEAAAAEEERGSFFVENHPLKVICLADFDSSAE